uniref:Aldedh domain-containing protein n=1 Tax=Syphacia muris TaxID=451379 RepID=A0A158R487_9BILA
MLRSKSRILNHFCSISRSYTTSLLPEGAKAFINGKWVPALSGETFEVNNPYNNELLYATANCDVSDAEKAVKAAKNASVHWSSSLTAKQRGEILRRWYNIYVSKEKELAELLTREQGKPLLEAIGEIRYAASFLDWYSGECRRVYGQVVPPTDIDKTHLHIREPIGVVAVITPWNFPSAMITRKAGAALAIGCTLVIKPAEDTPLSALALAQTAKEAGIPDGVFNVVPADLKKTCKISKYICNSTEVDAISFTGSTAVGKLLLAQSASTVKRVCLELGGNAPLIVFPSANLQTAVESAVASRFRGSGQTCISANRLFVHSDVYNSFAELLKAKVEKLVVGDGMKPGVTQGPLINERAVEKIENLVRDAIEKGAILCCGGKRVKGSTFYEPTILTNVKMNMDIAHTEIFGPVATLIKFDAEEEVVNMANDTRTGLAGYIFSQNISQISRVSRRLQVGMVGVNAGLISCAEAAFGGVKESGLGREGCSQGIDEFSQWKYICIAH